MNKTLKATIITASCLIGTLLISHCIKSINTSQEVDKIKTSDPHGIFFDSAEYPDNEDLKEVCYRLIRFKTKSKNIARLCIQEDPKDWELLEGLPQKDYELLPGTARFTAFQIMKKYYGKTSAKQISQ